MRCKSNTWDDAFGGTEYGIDSMLMEPISAPSRVPPTLFSPAVICKLLKMPPHPPRVMEVEQVLVLRVIGSSMVCMTLQLTCVWASPPLAEWLRDCDQQPCVYGLSLFAAIGVGGLAF